uniref:Uncharacterized protein n=1 Tax=Eutreptiella gymnastica TaxID=73025 RepID=A0A7S1I7H0_9EUGL|mmetsp:Transcript_13642/g.24367  ORF Transcript_13642/g.24367 Transcript_13642/m.24367 type:complete len:415 (+) Transcript_13642:56-1300(+)
MGFPLNPSPKQNHARDFIFFLRDVIWCVNIFFSCPFFLRFVNTMPELSAVPLPQGGRVGRLSTLVRQHQSLEAVSQDTPPLEPLNPMHHRLSGKEQLGGPAVYVHNPYWYPGFNLTTIWTPAHLPPRHVQSSPHGWPSADPTPGPWPEGTGRPLPCTCPACHVPWSPRVGKSQAVKTVTNVNRALPHTFSDLSDVFSDGTLGHSDSDDDICKRRPNAGLNEKIAALEQAIVDFCAAHPGSVPSERVQNIIKKEQPELYEAVVTRQFKKKWHKFLEQFPNKFILFTKPAQPAPEEDFCWRIRLTDGPAGWEAADAQEELRRQEWEEEVLRRVVALLQSCPDQTSSMNEIINELNAHLAAPTVPEDPSPSAATLHRRVRVVDLKKLLRRSGTHQFRVDDTPSQSLTHVQLLAPTAA